MHASATWDSIVLLQMGGPRRLDDIEPFLRRLFSDPDLIRLPSLLRPFQDSLARIIARKRVHVVRSRYERIGDGDGGASPILDLTRRQAKGLSERLGIPVHVCMRYSDPRADEVVAALQAQGARRVLLLPLYPHWSDSTTGSSLRDFAFAARSAGLEAEIRFVRAWGTHPGYVKATAAACHEACQGTARHAHLVLSAHSLPERYIRQGDPYQDQVEATAALLRSRLGGVFTTVRLGFQSAVGPGKWIGPETGDHIADLAREGAGTVFLAPLGFVTDHIETLHDLDHKYRTQAEALGMLALRVPSHNDSDGFLDGLVQVANGPTEPLEEGIDWTR